LLKSPKSSEEEVCIADDTSAVLFENISTPSSTIGATAARTGGRRHVADISLAHLTTELRNVFAGLKNRQLSKG